MSKLVTVIRRFALFISIVLAVTACAGAERVSIDAGEESLTREQLLELGIALQGGEAGATVSTTGLRGLGTAYLRSVAFLDFFEDQGLAEPDGLRGSIQDEIVDAGSLGEIGFIEFQSVGFEALVDIFVAQELLAQTQVGTLDTAFDANFPGQAEILAEYTDGFSVESRLGEWDDEAFVIVAP